MLFFSLKISFVSYRQWKTLQKHDNLVFCDQDYIISTWTMRVCQCEFRDKICLLQEK